MGNAAHPGIDTDALRAALARAEGMIRHYERGEEKAAQNAAMAAAGLPPIHDERSLKWDADQRRQYTREAEALRAVLAYFGDDQAVAA